MNKLNPRECWLDMRPDAQGFDEIRIITVPRYKESEISGDEWRISASIQLWRKGQMVHEDGSRNVETACMMVGAVYLRALDDAKGYFAGDGVTCDQEGCSAQATVRYLKKLNYSRDGVSSEPTRPTYRHFCSRHSTRGDCGMDDADRNYTSDSANPQHTGDSNG